MLYSGQSLDVVTYDEYADGDIRKTALDEIINTSETVYQSQISGEDDLYNKVLKIHDTLIGDIEYSEDVNIPISHSIAGAMTSGRSAVCEGYAKVMQVMMNCYGIENIYVTGLGNGGGHAWNMVFLRGGWFYIDVTDAICRKDPLYHWGMVHLLDRTICESNSEVLSCNCTPEFMRKMMCRKCC